MKFENNSNYTSTEKEDENCKKIKQCEYCKGKGLVQIAPNVRGLRKCPFCGGR